MNFISVAEFFKLATADYQEVMRKRIENPDIHEQLLLKHNIIPVQRSDTSLLGFGSTAFVYEVIYKEKYATAKITPYKPNIDIAMALYNLKDKLGEQAKHICDIYDLIYDKEEQLYIMIVEKLVPLNKNVFALLFPRRVDKSKIFVNRLNYYLNEPELLRQMIFDIIKALPVRYKDALCNMVMYSLRGVKSIDDVSIMMNEINDDMEKEFGQSEKIDLACKNIKLDLVYELTQHLPINYVANEGLHDVAAESSSLMLCFRKLLNFGYRWADMSENNIMERPATRDLVIADPGDFAHD